MLSLGNKLTLTTQPIYKFVNKYSIDFDGVDDRIITDGADTVAQPTTYSFWCKSSETGQNRGIFGHGGDNQGAFHYWSDTRPLIYLGANWFVKWDISPKQSDGEWHHWVVYSDPNNLNNCKLYVDGVLQNVYQVQTSGSLEAYTEGLTIGSDNQVGGNSFEGKIDEFAVYDRELTQAEITRMYNTYYSPNRVANGNFSQIGNEEVTNGDFSEIGNEQITNGNFSDGENNWSFGTGWSIIDGKATVVNQTGWLTTTGAPILANKQIKLQFDVVLTGGTLRVKNNTNDFDETFNTVGSYTITRYYSTGGSASNLQFPNYGSGFSGSIDNVSVKQVGQDWELGTGWSIGGGYVENVGDNSSLDQVNVLTIGKQYKLVIAVENTTSGLPLSVRLGSSSTYEILSITSDGTYTAYGVAGASRLRLRSQGFNGKITNISVKEVGQHWTFGTGWSTDGTNLLSTDSAQYVSANQNVAGITLGKTYKTTINVNSISGDYIIKFGSSGTVHALSSGLNTINAVWDGSNNSLAIYNNTSSTGNISIDYIVIQELKHDATNLMLNAGAYQSANPLITSTKSMDFDGSDDYLQLSEPFSHTNHTITGWFKLDVISGITTLFDSRDSADDGLIAYIDGTGRVSYRIGDGSGSTIHSSSLNANKWYNFACTYDGTTQTIYINGVDVVNTTVTKTISTTTNATIGKVSYTNALYFDGKITEVGAYNRALTPLEVASLYNQGMPTNLLVNRNDYQSGNPTVFNTKQVDFDGTDDYLELGSQSGVLRLAGSHGSISVWVKPTITGDTYQRIVDKSDGGSGANGYTLAMQTGSGNEGFIKGYINGNNPVSTTTGLTANVWSHVVWAWDGTNHKIYINGVLTVTSSSALKPPTDTTNMRIGSWNHDTAREFNGEMSQIGIWNESLTSDEVSSLYNHGLPIDLTTDQAAYESSSNLVGYWRMGSGTLDSYPLIADQTNATLGSELVTNGDFADTSVWEQLSSSITISGGSANYDGSIATSNMRQTLTTVANKVYKVTYTISNFTQGIGTVRLDGNYGTYRTANGTYTDYITVSGTSSTFQLYGLSSFIGSFDNVSAKQVQGNPAIMTNQTSSDIENGSPYANVIRNTDFINGDNWSVTRGNWAISGGTLNTTSESDYCNTTIGDYSNKTMRVKFDIVSNTQGSVAFRIFGSSYQVGTSRSGVGTYTEDIVFQAGHNGDVGFIGNNFTGAIDNVTVEEVNTGLQGYWKMGDGTNDEYPVIYDQTNPTNGSELVTNGDFATDSDWTKGTGWAISGGIATYDGSGGTQPISQSISNIQLGRLCKVTIDVLSNQGSGANTIFLGGTVVNSSHLGVGSYTFYGSFSSNTNLYIYGRSGEVFQIDNVSVKEVQGNPATMTNMVEGNITNQYPLTKIRNYYRMGDGILDGYPIIQDQTSPNLAHIPTTNILTYSEDFSNGIWTKENSTVTLNTVISPDGTQNATTLTEDTASGKHGLFANTTTTATSHSFSFFAKQNTRQYISIVNSDTVYWQSQLVVDLTDGSITKEYTKSYQLTNKVENFGNGWYKISSSIEGAFAGNSFYSRIYLSDVASPSNPPSNTYTGTGKSAYIWGAQLEAQSQATAYLKSDGIAAERKSSTTNLIEYSEDFSTYDQIQDITLTANATTSPIGTSNATKFTSSAASGSKVRDNISVVSGTTYTFSVYCKNIDATLIKLLVYDGVTSFNNVVTSEVSTTEWTRVSLTFTAGNTTSSGQVQIARDLPSGESAFFWGAQFEAQTQAETYAKTTGLPVTIDLFTENNYGTMTNMSASDIIEDTPNN
jgi:hypothetical protein